MWGRRFRPTLWGTLAAAVGLAVTVALGFWQLGRAQEKLDLAAEQERLAAGPPVHLGDALVAADQLENLPVVARGQFDPRGMVLLDNRVHQGMVGYEVVMPLRIGDGRMHVLVNRGWTRSTGDRQRLPEVRTPSGEVTIAGMAVVPGKHTLELSSDTIADKVWQNLTIERYRTRMNYGIQPIAIQQTSAIDDGLNRDWPTSERKINVHRSYAFQWFVFAVLICTIYIVLSLRRVATND